MLWKERKPYKGGASSGWVGQRIQAVDRCVRNTVQHRKRFPSLVPGDPHHLPSHDNGNSGKMSMSPPSRHLNLNLSSPPCVGSARLQGSPGDPLLEDGRGSLEGEQEEEEMEGLRGGLCDFGQKFGSGIPHFAGTPDVKHNLENGAHVCTRVTSLSCWAETHDPVFIYASSAVLPLSFLLSLPPFVYPPFLPTSLPSLPPSFLPSSFPSPSPTPPPLPFPASPTPPVPLPSLSSPATAACQACGTRRPQQRLFCYHHKPTLSNPKSTASTACAAANKT